jgi:Mce-associated membrane protein
VPPSKRTSSVLNGDHDDLTEEVDRVTNPDDALAAAEEAEAEAAEAEAQAAAARARARAIRLRREAAKAAAASTAAPTAEAPVAAATVEAPVTTEVAEVPSTATELDAPAVDEVVLADTTLTDEDGDLDDGLDDGLEDDEEQEPQPAAWKIIAKALVATVAILGSIALLGFSVQMYQQHREAEAHRQQTAEFAAAARQGAVTLMSLNFSSAKDDVQRIIDNTTGEFRKNFQDQAEDFIKVAQSSKVVTEASVNAVAVQKMTKDTATALVSVTTRVSNNAAGKQDPRPWRLMIDLQRDGGQIKLAKVEFVP